MFVAGGYFGYYDGRFIGQVEDGFLVETGVGGEPITGDNAGDAVQDIVIRPTNWFVSFTLLEWDTQAIWTLISPWLGANAIQPMANGLFGVAPVPGVLASNMYAPLELFATTGNPQIQPPQFGQPNAVTIGGRVWRFLSAGLAPDFPVRVLLAPRLRRVPLRFILLPKAEITAEWSGSGATVNVMKYRYLEYKP